jgi:hypothetical protein
MDNNHDQFSNVTILWDIMFCFSDLKAEALQISKRDTWEPSCLSSGIDPGPAGFAWSGLKTPRTGNWKSRLLHHSTSTTTMTHPRTGRTGYRLTRS